MIKARKLTCLGRRVVQTETKMAGGFRQVLTYYVDDADERNGGWPAGSTTLRTLKGDARRGTLQEAHPTKLIVGVR